MTKDTISYLAISLFFMGSLVMIGTGVSTAVLRMRSRTPHERNGDRLLGQLRVALALLMWGTGTVAIAFVHNLTLFAFVSLIVLPPSAYLFSKYFPEYRRWRASSAEEERPYGFTGKPRWPPR